MEFADNNPGGPRPQRSYALFLIAALSVLAAGFLDNQLPVHPPETGEPVKSQVPKTLPDTVDTVHLPPADSLVTAVRPESDPKRIQASTP